MAVELERLGGRELQQQAQSMNEDMSALAEEYGDQLSSIWKSCLNPCGKRLNLPPICNAAGQTYLERNGNQA